MRTDHTPAGRLNTALIGIRDSWEDTLEPARRAAGSHVLTSMVNPPLPVPADVLDKRAKAQQRLQYWSAQVIQGRRLRHLTRIDVAALCGFLQIHADWLAESKDGPKAVRDLEGSATDLGAIAAQNQPRHQDVGRCPGTTNGLPCPGMVKATIRRDDDLLPSELACDATPRHAWPAGEWKVLERRLHANAATAARLTVTRATTLDLAAARRLLAAISTGHAQP